MAKSSRMLVKRQGMTPTTTPGGEMRTRCVRVWTSTLQGQPTTRRSLCVVQARRSEKANGKMVTSVQQKSLADESGNGLDVKVAGGAVFAALVLALGISKVTRKQGSVERLVSRGMLDEYRERQDPYYKNMMKNINKVKVQPLTQEQIEEARKRRAGDMRARGSQTSGAKGKEGENLEDFNIPENHPWAEKKDVSKDDEELIKARLSVRRGLPLESLNDNKDA